MSTWRPVEVYASFMKLSGELEVAPSERFSDAVNRRDGYLRLRDTRAEPLALNYPVLSRTEGSTVIAKSAVILVCPVDEVRDGQDELREERVRQTAAVNTVAFSLVADLHLPPRARLEDELERRPRHFLPVTQVSALWLASAAGETHSVQRPFALLNPAAILSFSVR